MNESIRLHINVTATINTQVSNSNLEPEQAQGTKWNSPFLSDAQVGTTGDQTPSIPVCVRLVLTHRAFGGGGLPCFGGIVFYRHRLQKLYKLGSFLNTYK